MFRLTSLAWHANFDLLGNVRDFFVLIASNLFGNITYHLSYMCITFDGSCVARKTKITFSIHVHVCHLWCKIQM